jgi:hypothetical protein
VIHQVERRMRGAKTWQRIYRRVSTAVISSVNVILMVTGLPARDAVNLKAPTFQGAVMASILNKLRSFLSSPQGRRAIDQGRRYASNPRNRAKLLGLLSRRRRY